jgi:hypothetical protein
MFVFSVYGSYLTITFSKSAAGAAGISSQATILAGGPVGVQTKLEVVKRKKGRSWVREVPEEEYE